MIPKLHSVWSSGPSNLLVHVGHKVISMSSNWLYETALSSINCSVCSWYVMRVVLNTQGFLITLISFLDLDWW